MELQLEEKQRRACEGHEGKWVYDFTVDHKGDIPLRASTGAWKASLFVVAIEFSERLCYFGIVTNLITYLTKVLDQDLKTAAKNVNYWTGVTTLVPLIGGFLADAYIGRYRAIVISSVVYLLGLCLLTMSRYVPSLKPCDADPCQNAKNVHEVIFFIAMYLISLGTGGHKPSLESFGADQFDDHHVEERKKKMSYFNWWNIWLCGGVMLGVTVVVYVQDFVGWGVADIILTSVMAMSLAIFLTGTPFYRYRVPSGSPLTPMAQVLVAALSKRNLPHPPSPLQLYEVTESERSKRRRLCHTNKLRFLDKAAIIDEEERQTTEKLNPWKLATVTQVEEMKLVLNMVPIWLASLVFGICISQATTFFIKQGSTMNRKLTHSFTMPPASIFSFCTIGMIVTVCIYDKIVVPILRRMTGNERGISILQRIGIGMAFSVIAMITAAMVEKKRLHSVKEAGVSSMSVFWLAPQFIIFGIGDAFAVVGLQEYFYEQVPDTMRSLGIAFYLSVIGVANFISSLLITGVDHITEKEGSSWFAKDLNKSRLDNFYWLLAIMGGVNLCVYTALASRYTYKNVELKIADADFTERGNEGFSA